MVRQDIVAGLKNALERGISIESAKNSLLSAGYSMEDVEEASNFISAGSALSVQPQFVKERVDYVQPSKPANQQSPQVQQPVQQFQQPQPVQQFQQPQQFQQVQKQMLDSHFQQIPSRVNKGPGFFSRNWKILLLSSVLVVLLILFILILLFKDSIINMFF
jgi:hypothetical protein